MKGLHIDSAIHRGCAIVLVATAALVWAEATLMLRAAPARARTAAQGTKPESAPAGNPEKGRRLFVKYGCYECHGLEAQGAVVTGPRLGPNPIPLPALMMYVRNPTGEMPPYTEKVVSDQELADIHAFLESLPHPPGAKSIPLLQK